MGSEPFSIEFHSDAVARFEQLAQEILASIKSFGPASVPKPIRTSEIHPVAVITPNQIIGEIKVQQSAVNGLNEEMGRYWTSNGQKVGWQGPEFEQLKELARKFEATSSIRGRASQEFLLDEIFIWLQETLERKRNSTLTAYMAQRCSEEIREFEIWVPIYRTYSAVEFSIGSANFKTISKAMLGQWEAGIPAEDLASKPQLAVAINKERAALQGTLAVSVKTMAEAGKARAIAQKLATEAVGLLRFLSPVNWTCRLVSHCSPLGSENIRRTMAIFVEDGAIKKIAKGGVEQGPPAWNIDEARSDLPGFLEALHNLASHRDATPFATDLYGALQLYSRQSVALETSHKIVFVTVAIESLLLKDSNEPIQKNLGERMAFLIGKTIPERRDIIDNTDRFYGIRSKLIHHGRDPSLEDNDAIDRFFLNVWVALSRLVGSVDRYQTRQDMIAELENRKLS